MDAGAGEVEALERRRRLSPGVVREHWTMADGWPVRVARWQGARGTILFANGRADFIEKYAEAIVDWRARGWGVVAFDWRGQGGSGRLGRTPLHGHARDFAPWVADLRAIIGRVAGPGPMVGFGHSMGGHLWLRALAEGETRVARVALTSPMLGMAGAGAFARAASALTVGVGLSGAFAAGQRKTLPPDKAARRAAALTSDPERQTDEAWWLGRHPELALGGCTWGWLHAAFGSIAALDAPGVLEAVRVPVLASLAGDERVTDTAAALRALARLPGGGAEVFDGRHELLREADATRRAVLDRIGAFLERA